MVDLPQGVFANGIDDELEAAFQRELVGIEPMARFIDFTILKLMRRDHRSVFWGDRLVTLDKVMGFFEDPAFAAAYAKIAGAHVYDQYRTPHSIAWRLHTLVWAARQALALPAGDFVECGVFQGDMADVICNATDIGTSGRRMMLYDSFEGFHPELSSDADFPAVPGYIEQANAYYKRPGLYEGVAERFAARPWTHVVKGFLPESFALAPPPDRIAFLHIDLNSPKAEIACLEVLFDRVVPGGLIILDDYGWLVYRSQP
jgi:O-methyltransferase